jgi:DNA-binding transcriptional ArsR family regulator
VAPWAPPKLAQLLTYPMKRTIYINQGLLIELGIRNAAQGVIFDLLTRASQWATPSMIHNVEYYWVARQVICSDLPFFNLQPDTVYRHLKELEKLGVIYYAKDGKKDCIRLTEKSKKLVLSTMSEINPNSYVGKSPETNSEKNPTYLTTSINQESNTRTRDFDSFFCSYPRKKNPDFARQEYEAAITQGASHQQIMDSLKNHAVDWQDREERYIPYAGNWLAAGNWKSKYPERDKSLRLVVGRPLSRQETRRQITKSVLDVRNTDW